MSAQPPASVSSVVRHCGLVAQPHLALAVCRGSVAVGTSGLWRQLARWRASSSPPRAAQGCKRLGRGCARHGPAGSRREVAEPGLLHCRTLHHMFHPAKEWEPQSGADEQMLHRCLMCCRRPHMPEPAHGKGLSQGVPSKPGTGEHTPGHVDRETYGLSATVTMPDSTVQRGT